MLSVLIPVFNEENAVTETVTRVHDVLSKTGEAFEIVVINDGSTDSTAQKLQSLSLSNVQVFHHSTNTGYSASLKTGIRKSKGELIAITDADGTYPIEQIPVLMNHLKEKELDMVVGARTKKGVQIPLVRRPAKWIVNALANSLTGKKIPDLNSGLRVFTRSLAENFMHLYPQRFSFTMTITLAALTNDYLVDYIPIDYFKRTGSSTMSRGLNGPKNFVQFLSLIIRIVTYFRPLKFFLWPSVLLVGGGISWMIYTLITEQNISDSEVLIVLIGLQIGLFGMLAEIVVRHARVRS